MLIVRGLIEGAALVVLMAAVWYGISILASAEIVSDQHRDDA